jgi:hypothetical protein
MTFLQESSNFCGVFRQREKVLFFFPVKQAFSAAFFLLERLCIVFFQFLPDSTVQFCKRKAAIIHVEILPTVPSADALSFGVLMRAGIIAVP